MGDDSIDDGLLACGLDLSLRQHAAAFDLANDGRYRSVHLLDEFFHDVVRILGPSLFVEVGAFDATASRRVARDLPEARIVALEANPTNFARWKEKVDFEAEGVEYLNLAASDSAGPVSFYLRSEGLGGSDEDNSIVPLTGDRSQVDAVTVDGVRLDRYLEGDLREVAMWVDVEGANRQVLTGAAGLLPDVRLLKVEVEDEEMWSEQWRSLDVFEFLIGHGLIPIARDVQSPRQFNVVFASDDVIRHPKVLARRDVLYRQQLKRELPGPIGRVRRSPLARRIARRLISRADR